MMNYIDYSMTKELLYKIVKDIVSETHHLLDVNSDMYVSLYKFNGSPFLTEENYRVVLYGYIKELYGINRSYECEGIVTEVLKRLHE